MMHADPTLVPLAAAALHAGHHLGDYWLQTDHQAMTKGACGRAGRMACAAHVATLTMAQAALLGLVALTTATAWPVISVALALAVNAVSHYWADRRWTLKALTLRLTRTQGFQTHAGGLAHQDQAWHIAWMIPAALIMAAPPAGAALGTAAALAVLAVLDIASRRARRTESQTAPTA